MFKKSYLMAVSRTEIFVADAEGKKIWVQKLNLKIAGLCQS